MTIRWLKWVRVAVAVLFFTGLTLAFLNIRHLLPHHLTGWLAKVQFVPSATALITGVSLSLAAVVILAVTLMAGRIYCSAICPLGILQDLISRLAAPLRSKQTFLRFAPAKPWVRHFFFWATLLTIPVGGAGLGVALLDPYSNFGRIISLLARPVVALANNALLPLAEKWHWNGLYRVEITHAAPALLIGVGIFFLLLVVMAALRGRLYCNTVCPVGTLLGFLSARAFLKLKISADACGKCAECLKSCKAQCIDLKAGTVDASRCVACYNCLTACDRSAMQLKPDWTLPRKPTTTASAPPFDAERRKFLLTAAGGALVAGATALPAIARADNDDKKDKKKGESHGGERKYRNVITPPLAGDTETFLAHCTACQLCVSSCPTGVLQPAFLQYGPMHLLKPRMDYSQSFCNYTCHRCSEVCPTGALPFLPLPQKQVTRIGMAHFKAENCIVNVYHTDCGACSEHCPTKAVHMVPYQGGLTIPEVDKSLCIGCGACEFACPADTKAILVHGAPKSKIARRPGDGQATAPTPKNGFPF